MMGKGLAQNLAYSNSLQGLRPLEAFFISINFFVDLDRID
jgi:hypothetical protein